MSDLGAEATGPLTYDRLRELGLPAEDVAALEQRERDEAARLATDRDWARDFLRSCGIDPDDDADVRTACVAARDSHVQWRLGESDAIDADAYEMLLYAIRANAGWVHWPLDWPAVHIALMTQPLRNLLTRKPSGS